jgi:acyl dehydratase
MTLNRSRADATYRSIEPWEVRAEALAAYRDATLDADRGADGVAPIAYTIVPTWPVIQQVLADDDLGIDQTRCVQGGHRIELFEAIRAGDRLCSACRLARIETRGPHEVLTLHLTTANQHGRIVATQDVVCVIRGGEAGASRSATVRAAAFERTVTRVVLPPDLALRYAEASGDGSPIHTDDVFARRAGFASTVMQGMCLLAIALRPVEPAGLRVPRTVAARFNRPAHPADTVTFRHWSTDGGSAVDVLGDDGLLILEASIR